MCIRDRHPSVLEAAVTGEEDPDLGEKIIAWVVAEGHSNQGICERLFLSPKTLEGHVGNIFRKLDIGEAPSYHRRVVAVLTFLRAA